MGIRKEDCPCRTCPGGDCNDCPTCDICLVITGCISDDNEEEEEQ